MSKLETGYYSINNLIKLLIPRIYSKGDVIVTIHGEKFKVLSRMKVCDIVRMFDGDHIIHPYKDYSPNSYAFFGYELNRDNSSLKGVVIIHESEVI